MVVIKILSDKGQINTLHGRIIVGVLLVQDIFAVAALSILTTNLSLSAIASPLIKAFFFAIFAFILAKLFKPVFRISAKSNELMLIISLSFLFLFAISAYAFGLSIAIGAFFAGVALANSTFKTDIKGRIHPLRDFFGAILFVSLGIQLVWVPRAQWVFFGILILLVLIVKPIILSLLVRITGYSNRTSFLVGNYLGQSSEFVLILLTQGLLLNHIDNSLFSVLVFATIISMSLTSYSVGNEQGIYKSLGKFSFIFNKLPTKKEKLEYGLKKKTRVVLFGCHRIGTIFLDKLAHKKNEILVIDFNPEVIKSLIKKKIPCLYGDYANSEIIEKLKLPHVKPELIVSTISSKEDNINIIKKAKETDKNIIIIVVADSIHDALELYDEGADYVAIPKVISGESIGKLLGKIKKSKGKIKAKEVKFLEEAHYFLYDPRKKD